jgi:TPP-dependent 2-oxoacid decarboxylase
MKKQTTHTMFKKFSNLRYLNPRIWDRVNRLFSYSTIDSSFAKMTETQMKMINITKSKEKFTNILQNLEKHLLKRSMFNLKVENIPEKGILRDTNQETKIGYQNMRDTFGQFGNIKNILLVQGTAYIQYNRKDDSKNTHELINRMQMGKNIIVSQVIF